MIILLSCDANYILLTGRGDDPAEAEPVGLQTQDWPQQCDQCPGIQSMYTGESVSEWPTNVPTGCYV